MVAYSIFLNFVEILTLTTFVYLYYSLSSRKQFCLLLTSLFLICELCDIFRENGFMILIGYLSHVIHLSCTKKEEYTLEIYLY